jgi:hypothetical protein
MSGIHNGRARLLITVDAEALPKRAADSHVERLIWGRYPDGVAGIAELVAVSRLAEAPFLFFLEAAGAHRQPEEFRRVADYLSSHGQGIELHFHPEILGRNFWKQRGVELAGLRQDLFTRDAALKTLGFAVDTFEKLCGRRPRAYRAGSFRWNRWTIEALHDLNIGYSFNSCRETSMKSNFSTFAQDGSGCFRWSNQVVEVPCGEGTLQSELVHLRYPTRSPPGCDFHDLAQAVRSSNPDALVLVVVLHSWSLLGRDPQTGHARYDGGRLLDGFVRFIAKARRSFDFIGFDTLQAELADSTLPVRPLSDAPAT